MTAGDMVIVVVYFTHILQTKTIYIDGGKEEQYSTTQLFSLREVTTELYLLYLIAFNRVIVFLAIILSKGCVF